MGGAGDRSSRGCLAPAGGAWRRPGQATGQPVRRGRARPLHLIHGGALPDSARPERFDSNRPGRSATSGMPAAIIRGHDRLRERVLSGCAATEGAKRRGSGRASRCAGNQARAGPLTVRRQAGCPVSRRRSVDTPSGSSAGPPPLQVVLTDVAGSFPACPGLPARPADPRAARPVGETGVTPVPALVRDLIHEVLASSSSGVSCQRRCAQPLRAAQPGKRSAADLCG